MTRGQRVIYKQLGLAKLKKAVRTVRHGIHSRGGEVSIGHQILKLIQTHRESKS